MDLRQGPSAVLVLVFTALLLGVGLFILQEFRDTSSLTTTESVGNNTYFQQYYTTARFVGYQQIVNSTFKVFNYTGENILTAGVHYGLDPASGYLTFTPTGYGLVNDSNGLRYNTSFSYYDRTDAFKGINQSIAGINEFPSWMAIIVVVIAAAIIIGLITRNFGGGGVA